MRRPATTVNGHQEIRLGRPVFSGLAATSFQAGGRVFCRRAGIGTGKDFKLYPGGYLSAMAAAANYGRANRQLLSEATRDVFSGMTGAPLHLVYDVSHNLAKIETHAGRRLCVQRKGARLALPPGHPDLPADLRGTGQPVLIPGSMGTSSYVLAGVPGGGAFASACHGAGRMLSRHHAARSITGADLRRQLEGRGIAVRGASERGLAEETPRAYKDVTLVVEAAEGAGLCRKVARLVSLGVVKG